MKKITLILLITTLFSCSESRSTREPTLKEIRYITRESVKVGTLIKRDIVDKKAVFLCYPTYIKESYELIKYLGSILNEYNFDGVYIDRYPNRNSDILSDIKQQSPQFAFNSFVDLIEYFESQDIPVLNELKPTENKILILAPEEDFETIRYKTLRNINKKDIIFIALAGIRQSRDLFNVIDEIPYGKRIITIPLINSNYTYLNRDFYSLILMGRPSEYTLVESIELYSEECYLEAPKDYLEKHKSIFKSIHIERMNSVIPKAIRKAKKDLNIKDKEH